MAACEDNTQGFGSEAQRSFAGNPDATPSLMPWTTMTPVPAASTFETWDGVTLEGLRTAKQESFNRAYHYFAKNRSPIKKPVASAFGVVPNPGGTRGTTGGDVRNHETQSDRNGQLAFVCFEPVSCPVTASPQEAQPADDSAGVGLASDTKPVRDGMARPATKTSLKTAWPDEPETEEERNARKRSTKRKYAVLPAPRAHAVHTTALRAAHAATRALSWAASRNFTEVVPYELSR